MKVQDIGSLKSNLREIQKYIELNFPDNKELQTKVQECLHIVKSNEK